MKHALYVSNFGEFADVRRVAALACEAEEAGYDGLFLSDSLLPTGPDGMPVAVADVQVALTAMALATSRIRLGAMVTPLARRRPVKFAREALTLDNLSGGRVVIGAGLGHDVLNEFERLGEPTAPRVRADILDESLYVIDGLLRGDAVSLAGEHVRICDTRLEGPGASTPRVPIWVGCSPYSPRPLRRAARWDGVFALPPDLTAMSPGDVATMRDVIAEHRATTASFDIAVAASFPDNVPLPEAETMAEYERAGTTWWLEYAWSPSQARDLVARGRPNSELPPS